MKAYPEFTISDCIMIKRKRLKLSQTDLAAAVNVSRNYISMIERGFYDNVSIKVLRDICKELDLEMYVVNNDGIGTHRTIPL